VTVRTSAAAATQSSRPRPASPPAPPASSPPCRSRPAPPTSGALAAGPSPPGPAPARSPSRPALRAPSTWAAWRATPPAPRPPRARHLRHRGAAHPSVITAPAFVSAGATGTLASVRPRRAAPMPGASPAVPSPPAPRPGRSPSPPDLRDGPADLRRDQRRRDAQPPGNRQQQHRAGPGTPVLTAPSSVTAGATGLVASRAALAGATYTWTITGGTSPRAARPTRSPSRPAFPVRCS